MSNRFHNKFHRHNHHTDLTDRNKYPDSAYDPIASRESPFQGEFYSQGDITTTEDLSVGKDIYAQSADFSQNVSVLGNLSIEGQTTQLNTDVYVTSSLQVNYTGNSVAFTVNDGTNYILHVKGNTPQKQRHVGIGTQNPNEELTVVGDISASGLIYDGSKDSSQWNSVYTTVLNTSSQWTSAYNSIETLQTTLTAFSALQPQIQNLADFSPTITVNKSNSSVLIQGTFNITGTLSTLSTIYVEQDLIVKNSTFLSGNASVVGNLSVNSEFGFSKFKSLNVNFTNTNYQLFTIPNSSVNDLVVVTNDDFSSSLNTATISAFTSGVANGFYILTNGMSSVNLEILSNQNIRLRGSNTLSLTLSYGDSCCMRCRTDNIVSIW